MNIFLNIIQYSIEKQIQKMTNQNILVDCDNKSASNNRAKLSYFETEKARLETIVTELEQMINLQRIVNNQISKNNNNQPNNVVTALNEQNCTLSQQYQRIYKQNLQLSAKHLLLQQILDENQIQFNMTLAAYQAKIIELRRTIQTKESFIQQLESQTKSTKDMHIAPATNLNRLFFNEIEDLKKVIADMTIKNKQLKASNEKYLIQVERADKRLTLLQALTMKSKLTFQQFKNFYSSTRSKVYSAPKKDTCIPLDQRLSSICISSRKQDQAYTRSTTREFQEELTSIRDNSLKMIVYKQYLQIDALKKALVQSKECLRNSEKSKKHIVNSYNKEIERIHLLINELNYYKKSTQDLLKLMACRRLQSKSQERSTLQKIVSTIKNPQETDHIIDHKKYWLGVHKSIKIQKLNVLSVKRKYGKIYRSISCVTDYRRIDSDMVERNVNKKPNNHKINKKMEEQQLNDFSAMIQGPFDMDFTIIQPSKRTYSEWKQGRRKTAIMNLTILEENIL